MSLPRSAVLRRFADLEGPGGWLVNAVIVAYVVGTTWWRVVPIGPGVGFLPVWTLVVIGLVGMAQAFASRSGRLLAPLEVAPLLALPGCLLTDITMIYQPLRDLGIYLKAGNHFLAGQPVYITAPLHARPDDLSNYPFLYPPLTLPLFGLLSALPEIVAQVMWVAASVALGIVAVRAMGLRWRWAILSLLWPPMFQGLLVGNVAVPALALFALAPAFGSGLVVAAIFKSYTGVTGLWLVRERRWVDLLRGIGLVTLAAAVTLPLTGVRAWQDWIGALHLYQLSQEFVPALYGFGLARFLPLWLFLALSAGALVAALTRGGKDGLARLGTATVVASPSLWGHGMLMTIPSMLSLRPMLAWLAIAVATVPDGIQWWWLVAIVAASWVLPGLRRETASAEARPRRDSWLDPLVPGGSGPWPDPEPEIRLGTPSE